MDEYEIFTSHERQEDDERAWMRAVIILGTLAVLYFGGHFLYYLIFIK